MDELDELTKKEEVKNLGKLQYSLDYDFQQNNVRNKAGSIESLHLTPYRLARRFNLTSLRSPRDGYGQRRFSLTLICSSCSWLASQRSDE